MVQNSDKQISEMKRILEKNEKREVTWEEAKKANDNLVGLAEILFKMWLEDNKKKEKLKDYPKGYILDGVGYTCRICRNCTGEQENWYDKYGIKCMTCQKAIDKKIIPGSLTKHDDSWYSKYDLESSFNLPKPLIQKWVKAGLLKDRIIKGENGRNHLQLFLIKDNKDFLPPKKLVASKMVKETKDGKDWFHCEPWYKFFDPFEHLKGYKILDWLTITYGDKEK